MRISFRLAVAVCLLCVVGCQGDSIEARVAALNSSRVQQLYNCYSLYLHYNRYRGPQNEAEFKAFLLEPRYEKNLSRMQIDPDNLDELFIGERDGEPYVIRYGINGLGDKAIIFEATGVDGKRWVALQTPKEVNAEEYDAYLSGKTKPKAMTNNQGPGPDA